MTVAAASMSSPARASSAVQPATSGAWHVSPAVDLIGYAFSWVLLALPLYLVLGSDVLRLEEYRAEGFAFVAGAVVLIDVHRHFTFPYAYLDRRRRQAFPLRFWLLPAVCLLLLSRLPFLASSQMLLYPAESAAIVAWVVVLTQLLRVDALGARARRSALTAALVALGAAALLETTLIGSWARMSAGWAWLLGAASASVGVWRAASAAGAFAPRSATRWIAPAGMVALIAAAATVPVTLPVRAFVSALGAIYLVWLVYHVLSQKYGILRIYSAKAGTAVQVPRWVDRSVVWCWFPMVIVGSLIQTPGDVLLHVAHMSPSLNGLLDPLVLSLAAHPALWLAASALPIVAAHGAFLYFEWRVHRMRNVPRLAFMAGTGVLFASFFWIGVVGLNGAIAANHCIEYLTFLWALQRQRYPQLDPQAPILSRVIQWPVLYYGGIALAVGAVAFLARYGGHYFPTSAMASLTLYGYPLYTWAFWYSIMQAFLHFYYDGFLWKMKPELVRAL